MTAVCIIGAFGGRVLIKITAGCQHEYQIFKETSMMSCGQPTLTGHMPKCNGSGFTLC